MVESNVTASCNVKFMATEEKIRNSMVQSNIAASPNVEVIAK